MSYEIHPEKGLVNRGNWYRIKECMRRARGGDRITIGFLGGSITQGAVAEYHSNCYAHLVFEWWERRFPKTAFTYANAGIGGTTSQFGAARVDRDLMVYHPDMVFIEFSVNDENTPFFKETYEGLVRRVWKDPLAPAVALIHNIMYDKGTTAQEIHQSIGEHYDLPCVCMKTTIYEEVKSGRIANREITPDDLHPNTEGHALVASVIIDFLEKVYAQLDIEEEAPGQIKAPVTENCYEDSVRFQNGIYYPNNFAGRKCTVETQGFEADQAPQKHLYDFCRNGWTARAEGDTIRFETEGTELAVQYCKTIHQPAPVAEAVVDGDSAHPVVLDANFDETWGDCLYMQNLMVHGTPGKHTVEIRITKTHENDAAPFYLVSLVAAGAVSK